MVLYGTVPSAVCSTSVVLLIPSKKENILLWYYLEVSCSIYALKQPDCFDGKRFLREGEDVVTEVGNYG
jgi:hypothetical protein